jgi:hypothetical protein
MLHEALRLFGTASAIRWGLRLMPKKETGSHRSDVDCHVKPVTASSCTQKFILLHLINLLLNSSLDFLDKPTECRSKLYARIFVSFSPLDLLSVDRKMCVRDVFRLAHLVNLVYQTQPSSLATPSSCVDVQAPKDRVLRRGVQLRTSPMRNRRMLTRTLQNTTSCRCRGSENGKPDSGRRGNI